MPINGLGTYSLARGRVHQRRQVRVCQCGVRLIDTASAYGNEEEIGQAIRESNRRGNWASSGKKSL